MKETFRDARLDELSFLADLARIQGEGWTTYQSASDTPQRRMVVQLLVDSCLNDVGSLAWHYSQYNDLGAIDRNLANRRLETLSQILSGQSAQITIGHKGRVRMAELAQAMTATRQRDPTGVVWSKRHFPTDLEIAIRSANEDTPAGLAVFDMNGLKQLNDRMGHTAGDRAIFRYLKSIASVLRQGIEAYRGDGGDEVYLIAAGSVAHELPAIAESAMRVMMNDRDDGGEPTYASCGLAFASSSSEAPTKLADRADAALCRAKEVAHAPGGGRCAVAADGSQPKEIKS